MEIDVVMQYFVDNAEPEQVKTVLQALTTYGDPGMPLATTESLTVFNPLYVMHCLGRQFFGIVGTRYMIEGRMDEEHTNLFEMHQDIADLLTNAIDFAK